MANRILFDFVAHQVAVISEKGKKEPAGAKPVDVSSGAKPIEGVGTAIAAFVGLPLVMRHLEPLADETWLALGVGTGLIRVDPPGEVDLALLVSVAAPAGEARLSTAHRFSLRVLDPYGGLIGEQMEIRVNLVSGSHVPDDWELTAQLPILVRIPVETPGVHQAEMHFDDSIRRQTLVVSAPNA